MTSGDGKDTGNVKRKQ